MRRKEAHRRFAPAVGFALFATILLIPSLAFAQSLIQNHMEGAVDDARVGPQFYAYHQGSRAAYDQTVDFDLGIYDDTEVDATGTNLQLRSVVTGAWWDTSWGARRCFTVDNIGPALSEHQVRVVFDGTQDMADGLLQIDGADYRAIADDNTTQLDLFVEEGVGTAATVVWIQLDVAGFTTTDFCLYFANPTAPSVSSQPAVFSYSTMRRLYYPLYWPFDGSGGINGTIDLVSYVDNNQISVGGATITLNAGQSAPFSNITPDTEILSTGPIGGRGRGNGQDALVPVNFAGTEMVFPTNRATNRFTLVSPTGVPASVEIYNGTNLVWTGTVGASAVIADAEINGPRSAVIRSTGGVPIIATHTATTNSLSDAQVVPPWFGDDLYGVRSRSLNVGFVDAGSVDVWMHPGTTTTVTGGAGSESTLNNGSDFDGDGTAMRLTNMTTPIGALQQADRDGNESTAFLPQRLLDNEYFLPSDADYVAFSCPTAMNITVGGAVLNCGPILPGFPGHAIAGFTAQGSHIFSDTGEPFFAYYEDTRNDDETNLLGMKSAWAFSQYDLPVTGTPTELLPAAPTSGRWTSPVIDTTAGGTNVFGLLSAVATLPAGTDVTMQVARGATPALAASAPFLGPDGTSATTFAAGDNPVPYAWDFGDAYYVVRVELSATTPGDTPLVDTVSLGYDLPEVHQSSLHVVDTTGATPDRDWVLRIWTQDPVLIGATATVLHASSTGLTGASTATFDLETTAQIVIAGGMVVQDSGAPVAIGPGLAQSIAVDTQNMVGVDTDAVWQGAVGGVLVTHRLRISFI